MEREDATDAMEPVTVSAVTDQACVTMYLTKDLKIVPYVTVPEDTIAGDMGFIQIKENVAYAMVKAGGRGWR